MEKEIEKEIEGIYYDILRGDLKHLELQLLRLRKII